MRRFLVKRQNTTGSGRPPSVRVSQGSAGKYSLRHSRYESVGTAPFLPFAGYPHEMQKHLRKGTTCPESGVSVHGLLLIEFLQLLDPAKGDPVNDCLIHSHHECRCNDKLAVLIIDLIHCLSNRMRPGAKHLQLLALMGDQVIDTDCQVPDPFLVA